MQRQENGENFMKRFECRRSTDHPMVTPRRQAFTIKFGLDLKSGSVLGPGGKAWLVDRDAPELMAGSNVQRLSIGPAEARSW